VFFFFQAEDGIRDFHVTGVQTCALPILGVKVDSAAQLDTLLESVAAPLSGFADSVVVVEAGQPCSLVLSGLEAPCTWRLQLDDRSEERRVGKEGRARWSRDH